MSPIPSIRREVMRRIYFIFFARTVVKPLAVKGVFALAGAAAVAGLVSVRSVYWNSPSPAEFAAFGKFVLSAFLNTELAVQALALVLVALAAWSLRDLARISRFFTLRRAVI